MTDPRYDPSFQRGYDGPPPTLVVRASPSTTASAAPAGRLEQPATEPTEAPPSEPTADEVDEVDDQPAFAPARRFNPYSLALLIVGIVATAVGAWMLQRLAAGAVQFNGNDPGQLLWQVLIQQLAPGLIMGGVVAIAAWLVLGALAARDVPRD